jgi:hypothetical protein
VVNGTVDLDPYKATAVPCRTHCFLEGFSGRYAGLLRQRGGAYPAEWGNFRAPDRTPIGFALQAGVRPSSVVCLARRTLARLPGASTSPNVHGTVRDA